MKSFLFQNWWAVVILACIVSTVIIVLIWRKYGSSTKGIPIPEGFLQRLQDIMKNHEGSKEVGNRALLVSREKETGYLRVLWLNRQTQLTEAYWLSPDSLLISVMKTKAGEVVDKERPATNKDWDSLRRKLVLLQQDSNVPPPRVRSLPKKIIEIDRRPK